jgi:outer membrane lipoprotein carrier protein
MTLRWRSGWVLLLAMGCARVCAAQADAGLLRRVDEHYNHLRTLRARYTEHYTGMGLDKRESGTLTLKKPGLMRWSYDTPAGKVFVLDGKFAWFYTPGDAQVSRMPAKQMDDLRTPLRFLLGHTELAKELDGVTTAADGADFRIAGVPKGMGGRVKRLTLRVTAAGAIEGMKIEEVDGAVTEFAFTGMEENVGLGAGEFVFVQPAGTTVVNAGAPI